MEQGLDQAAGHRVKQPDENAHNDNTGDDDQGVVDGLLAGGPHDLLQLDLQFPEPTADAGKDAGLGLFVGLLVLLGLIGLGSGGNALLHLFVLSHLCYPSFLSAIPEELLRLIVDGVLSAEGAVFVQLQAVRGILLVLHGVEIGRASCRERV